MKIITIVTDTIINELKEISDRNDDDAIAARKWLSQSDRMIIQKTKEMKSGEDELYEICRVEKIFLISDDVKAIKRFQQRIKWYFSVHIVYLLYKRDLITKERAIASIEKMKLMRDWKNNIISVTARIIFREEYEL